MFKKTRVGILFFALLFVISLACAPPTRDQKIILINKLATKHAAQVLEKIVDSGDLYVPELIGMLGNSDSRIESGIEEALFKIRSSQVKISLVRAVDSPDVRVGSSALTVILRIGEDEDFEWGFPFYLEPTNPKVKNCIQFIFENGKTQSKILCVKFVAYALMDEFSAHLLRLSNDNDQRLRYRSSYALGRTVAPASFGKVSALMETGSVEKLEGFCRGMRGNPLLTFYQVELFLSTLRRHPDTYVRQAAETILQDFRFRQTKDSNDK